MAQNDGGPAFPHDADYVRDSDGEYRFKIDFHRGMSTRTWLAGQAMKGLLSNPVTFEAALDEAASRNMQVGEVVCEQARLYADHLLVEMEKD